MHQGTALQGWTAQARCNCWPLNKLPIRNVVNKHLKIQRVFWLVLLTDLILPTPTIAPFQDFFQPVCFFFSLPTCTSKGSLIILLLCFLTSLHMAQHKEGTAIWVVCAWFIFFPQKIASIFFAFNSSTHPFLGQLRLFWVVSLFLAFSPLQSPPMLSHWQVPSFYTTSSRSLILGVKSAVLTLILLCSSRH